MGGGVTRRDRVLSLPGLVADRDRCGCPQSYRYPVGVRNHRCRCFHSINVTAGLPIKSPTRVWLETLGAKSGERAPRDMAVFSEKRLPGLKATIQLFFSTKPPRLDIRSSAMNGRKGESRVSLDSGEVALAGRQTEGPTRNPPIDPKYKPRQPAVGRPPDPGRTHRSVLSRAGSKMHRLPLIAKPINPN
jgi:hypothetical protein